MTPSEIRLELEPVSDLNVRCHKRVARGNGPSISVACCTCSNVVVHMKIQRKYVGMVLRVDLNVYGTLKKKDKISSFLLPS